jgi:hypothetical protein
MLGRMRGEQVRSVPAMVRSNLMILWRRAKIA